MRRRTRISALAVLALLIGASAEAEIYRWTDEKGKLHFTSSLEKVPPRYQYQLGRTPNDPKGTVSIIGSGSEESTGSPPDERLERLRRKNRELTKRPGQATGINKIGGLPKPSPVEKPDHLYDIKCNSRGGNCRRIQTPEFREWKLLQKYKDGVPAASEN